MKRRTMHPLMVVVALVAATTAWAHGARPFADLLLQVLDIRLGSTVAEVGAGRGDFAFRMAEAVGPKGRVYANEIAQENVAEIERAKRDGGVSNLVAVLGDESDPRLYRPRKARALRAPDGRTGAPRGQAGRDAAMRHVRPD